MGLCERSTLSKKGESQLGDIQRRWCHLGIERQFLKRKNASWDDKCCSLLDIIDIALQWWLSAN